MKIITYTDLADFEAWSGALPTLRRLIDEDLTDHEEFKERKEEIASYYRDWKIPIFFILPILPHF